MPKDNLKYFLSIVFLITPFLAAGQQQDEQIQAALEDLAEESEQETEDDEFWQQLELYQKHPLNINRASYEDLTLFTFLNPLQIESLLHYKKLLGELISIYELQAVPGFDIITIRKLLPYIYVSDNPFDKSYRFKDYFHHGDWEVLFRYKRDIEKKKGFIKKDSLGRTHYLGDPNSLFFRMRYRFGSNLSMGITADRDAGEPFTGYSQKGFDFYSLHLFLKGYKSIRALAIGDYRINLGQGLINKQGLTFGKSSTVMNIDKSGSIITPHTSSMEYGFYRGGAISFGKKKINSTLFFSYKPEDASLTPLDSVQNYFKTFQSSGYHRSETELKNKGAVKLLSTGGSVRYDFKQGHVAFNTVYHSFSDSMKHTNQWYDLYGHEGKEMLNASLDYALFMRQFYFFGETATDKAGALATVNGLVMSVDPRADISLLYRNYSRAYTSLYTTAFGESTKPQNEHGFYAGISLRPKNKWQLNAYADIFSFPWLRYRIDELSGGKDYFIQTTYSPSKKLNVYLRFRDKQKSLNQLKEAPMANIIPTHKQSLRLQTDWKYSGHFRFRNVAEFSSFRGGNDPVSRGYFLAQDLIWKTNKSFSGNFRIAWFQTDDYDTRIYAFENEVRYAYSIPFFYGNGIRSYVNFRINPARKLSLWTKFSRTWYFNQQTIGSSWDEIQGNKRTNVTLEIIYGFK
ncbi:MAG: helix-hairpin-helix domain-containing protein [Chitinophagaceae bacterium]|nr:MAG: helix-hairpin-helix domain-containing protein [Chitinophagaceae bacterium]